MSRDTMASYNQKFDLLYENHTDLNKALKFDSVKLNCGKDFNIFRLLEQVKSHRKPVNEGTPKCVECLLEDATCTTTVICTTAPACTTTPCPTTCGKNSNGGAPRKSTPRAKLSKKPEPLRHNQDPQHNKPEQIIKLMSRQESPIMNTTHPRRIQEGLGSKPANQHFDAHPGNVDRFSQWRAAHESKLGINNEQPSGHATVNLPSAERPNFVEPRKLDQNLKESRIEEQNAVPSKTEEQSIPLPIQSSVTSRVYQNTIASENQNSLLPNTGDGVKNIGQVQNPEIQNAVMTPKAGVQNAASPLESGQVILTANTLEKNSVMSQAVSQCDHVPKAVAHVSVAPKTSEKNVVVVSMAVAHNLAANEGGQKEIIGEQQSLASKPSDQISLISKPGIQDNLAHIAGGQNALGNKAEAGNTVALEDHEMNPHKEDRNSVAQLGANENAMLNKQEVQNIAAAPIVIDSKPNDQVNIVPKADDNGVIPMGGDQSIIPNKVGELNGEVQQLGDQHIVEPMSGEQIPFGYKIGGSHDMSPISEVILPKGGDQNDIAQKAGELFGVVPPNLETQNVISPKFTDQHIIGSKAEEQNVGLKDHNTIAFRTGERNTIASNQDHNAAINTKEINIIPLKPDHQAPIADDQNIVLKTNDVNFAQNIAPQPGDHHFVESIKNEVTQRIQDTHESEIDQNVIDSESSLKKQPDLAHLQSYELDNTFTNADS